MNLSAPVISLVWNFITYLFYSALVSSLLLFSPIQPNHINVSETLVSFFHYSIHTSSSASLSALYRIQFGLTLGNPSESKHNPTFQIFSTLLCVCVCVCGVCKFIRKGKE